MKITGPPRCPRGPRPCRCPRDVISYMHAHAQIYTQHKRMLPDCLFLPFTFSHSSCVHLKMTRCHGFLIWIHTHTHTHTQEWSEPDTQVLRKPLIVDVPRGCPKQRQNKCMAHTCCKRLGFFLFLQVRVYLNRLHVFPLVWKLFYFGGNLYYKKGALVNYCLCWKMTDHTLGEQPGVLQCSMNVVR